jgi:phage/conjugal plasmid C-4 type zinc finger TraR family protein
LDEADWAQVFSDRYLEGAMNAYRANIPSGESLEYCEDCGRPIPDARREAVPGVRKCIHCQQNSEAGCGKRGAS